MSSFLPHLGASVQLLHADEDVSIPLVNLDDSSAHRRGIEDQRVDPFEGDHGHGQRFEQHRVGVGRVLGPPGDGDGDLGAKKDAIAR